MSGRTDDQAFPRAGAQFSTPVEGMTLREYIATAAMQGLCANSDFDMNAEEIAASAVEHADALLAELAKPKAVPA